MMKEFTIKDVADMAGVSKNAIRFRIGKIKDFSKHYMRIGSNRTRLISNAGVKKLLGQETGKPSSARSSQLTIKYLMNQIDDLRHQRDKSQDEVSRLTKLLAHEQELNLTAQNQLKSLRGTVKHGWIWRLFH